MHSLYNQDVASTLARALLQQKSEDFVSEDLDTIPANSTTNKAAIPKGEDEVDDEEVADAVEDSEETKQEKDGVDYEGK